MQIEEGKYYRNRKNDVIGPIEREDHAVFPFSGRIEGRSTVMAFTKYGGYHSDGERHPLDLTEEWPMEAHTVSFDVDGTYTPVVSDPAYASLAGILQAAHDQAARGKGRDRHSDDKPFLEQPIMEIARMLGDTSGHSYQIMKKAQEANRMVRRDQHDAAVREFLGVINYAAAAILLIREL